MGGGIAAADISFDERGLAAPFADEIYRLGPSFRVDVIHDHAGTRLRQRLIIGPSLSATGRAMEANPDQAQQILANRREQHRGNMILNLQGIKDLAEADA